jgi:cytochrome c oxidase subunit 4
MTLAELRGIKPAAVEAAPAHRQGAHPGPAEYVKIGLTLAVVTAVEVAVYYVDALSDVLVPILIVLSALKFSLVVMWFMHLKFDNRMFSTFFVGGLMLVAALFVVVLATLGGGLV